MKWGGLKLSKYKLIQEELEYLDIRNGSIIDKLLWTFIKRESIEYEVNIATSVFLRLKVFCEDIEDLSGISYTVEDLINGLYNGFLYHKKINPDIDLLYNQLSLQLDLFGKNMFQPIDKHENENYERLIYKDAELVSTYKNELPSFITIKMRINRKKALRGEVILADMEMKYPEHSFSIESILAILIYDFINDVKNGKAKHHIETIINYLK